MQYERNSGRRTIARLFEDCLQPAVCYGYEEIAGRIHEPKLNTVTPETINWLTQRR